MFCVVDATKQWSWNISKNLVLRRRKNLLNSLVKSFCELKIVFVHAMHVMTRYIIDAPMLCHLLAKRLNSNLPFLKFIRLRTKDDNSLTSSTDRTKTKLYSLATLANSSEGFFVSCLFLLKINYHAIFDKAIQNRLWAKRLTLETEGFF